MNRNVFGAEGGDKRERDASPPSQEAGGQRKPSRGTCGAMPPRVPLRAVPCPRGGAGPTPLEAAGFVRSGTAGNEKRNSASPGGEDTVTRAEDHLWQQIQAGPLWCLRTGGRACLRAHTAASARNSHAPGPVPTRLQIRLPGLDREGPRRRL